MSTTAPPATRPGPAWRERLESLPVERLRGVGVAAALVLAGAAVLALNLSGAPLRTAGEGTIVSRAWAVQYMDRLVPGAYLYDQPPLGWLQVSLWARLTGAFDRAPTAVAAGREAMVVAFLPSAALLWALARRLGLARWSAALALAVFGLSPLAVALHRQVSLENLATPWLLAAFVVAAGPTRRLGSLAATGALLGLAALTSPDALLVLPALALLLWRAAPSEARTYVLPAAATAFVATCATYPAYAVLKGELTSDVGPSLARGLGDQLLDLTRTGSVFSAGTTGHGIVAGWLGLDPLLPTLGLAAAIFALVSLPRLAPVAVAFLVVAAAVVRPGHLTPSLPVLSLPFAALLVAGAAERLWPQGAAPPARARARRAAARGDDLADDPAARATGPGPVPAARTGARPGGVGERPPGRGRAAAPGERLPVAFVAAALAAVAVAAVWAPDGRALLSRDDEAVPRDAAVWVAANAGGGPILADAGLWADLAQAGVPPTRLVIHPSIDDPPPARIITLRLWPTAGAIVSSPVTRAGALADPRLGELLDKSLVVAGFGDGDGRVEVRAVDPQATDVASLRRHDPATAAATGAELAGDGDLAVAPDARALLVAGEVDERVMGGLAAVVTATAGAGAGPVEVAGFPADPAELAAGEARRAVVLRAADREATTDVVRVLRAQAPGYRPASVTVGEDGRVTATWAIAALSRP
jgi:hypothetical protein